MKKNESEEIDLEAILAQLDRIEKKRWASTSTVCLISGAVALFCGLLGQLGLMIVGVALLFTWFVTDKALAMPSRLRKFFLEVKGELFSRGNSKRG